jgi:hypothetical protein
MRTDAFAAAPLFFDVKQPGQQNTTMRNKWSSLVCEHMRPGCTEKHDGMLGMDAKNKVGSPLR